MMNFVAAFFDFKIEKDIKGFVKKIWVSNVLCVTLYYDILQFCGNNDS